MSLDGIDEGKSHRIQTAETNSGPGLEPLTMQCPVVASSCREIGQSPDLSCRIRRLPFPPFRLAEPLSLIHINCQPDLRQEACCHDRNLPQIYTG